MSTHLVIPDTQAKDGTPTDHLRWIGQLIVDEHPDTVVHLGDHADMPSLSSYDVGKRSFEGRRYSADIEAANRAFDVLNAPLDAFNDHRRAMKEKKWRPRRVITLGNHEDRINRATNDDAKLHGLISTDDLNYAAHGFEVIPFLKPIEIDGIWYCHYYAAPFTGRPYGGTAATRLKTIGHSFVMGHQQTLDYSVRFLTDGTQQIGIVAGAAYLHAEDYKGVQNNAHWRGVILLQQVENGTADPRFISLDQLCRRYEGKPLATFIVRKHGLSVFGLPL
jgi:hypothetical protein